MKVERSLLTLSNLSGVIAAVTPIEDQYAANRLGLRIPDVFDHNEDIVTVTANNCAGTAITSYITETWAATGIAVSVPTGIPISELPDGQPQAGGAAGISQSSGVPAPFLSTGFPVTSGFATISGSKAIPTASATSSASCSAPSPATPATGVIREYWLAVVNGTLAPDGFSRQVLTFNGTIPGPVLTANVGDTFRIHVVNQLQSNGTAIHWHGQRQLNTNDQDGVPGLTECPIAPGQTKTYEFLASSAGTSWYHSHFSAQYGDGAIGSMVIHGGDTSGYDEDLGPILVQDWYRQTVFQEEWYAQHIGAPTADNYLINGVNVPADNTTTGGSHATFKFAAGKKYRMRFINGATDNFFKIALDGHKFTVIAVDFTPVEPFQTDYLPLGIGQRIDVIVEANAGVSSYWLRAMAQSSCCANANDGLGTANGIVTYNGAASGVPTTTAETFPDDCHDLPVASLVPISKACVPTTTFDSDEILPVSGPTVANTSYGTNVFTWKLDSVAIDIDWNNPTLLQVQNGVTTFDAVENVIKLDTANVWKYWIIQNKFQIAHPMHLHGHSFAILGQGTGTFDSSNSTLNFDNPPFRDTAMLIENGWTVMAFLTDNPGAWLFHCHIGWHVASGLSLQFLERESEILSSVKINDAAFANTCNNFGTYSNSAADIYGKTDSGL